MKKIILGIAAAAAATFAAGAVMAQPYGGYDRGYSHYDSYDYRGGYDREYRHTRYRDSDRDGIPDRAEWNRDRDRDGRPDQYDRYDNRRDRYGRHHHRHRHDGWRHDYRPDYRYDYRY